MTGASRAMLLIRGFFSSRRRHTRYSRGWSSDVCSSDLADTIRGYQDADESAPAWQQRLVSKRLRGVRVPTFLQWGFDDRNVGHGQLDRIWPHLRGPRGSEDRRVGEERRSRWSPYN